MIAENRFYLKILSPVHVGCDEYYEPMSFVLDENNHKLTAFDPVDFFRALGPKDRERYASICKKGTIESILEMYKFMRGKQYQGVRVSVCSGLVAQYQKTIGMSITDQRKIQQELNNFSIARTSFNSHDNRPYIPGSAIKGALRTAWLNRQQKIKKLPKVQDGRRAPTLEKDLLDGGSFNTDPFRMVKVSDFMPVNPETFIVFAVNEKKIPSKFSARGPYQILEIIEPGTIFTGTISIEERYAKEAGIRTPLAEKTLFGDALDFYRGEMNREKDELLDAGLPFPKLDLSDGSLPIRIGRHSGAESLTIKGHRSIRIKGAHGQSHNSDKATTFWLAAETSKGYNTDTLQPFGWASLGKMTETMAASFEQMRMERKAAETALSEAEAQVAAVAPIEKPREPENEIWESAFVTFNAGGGGVATARKGSDGAELRGKEKIMVATDPTLHKKLFEKKEIKSARVTVHKVGNNYLIDAIAPGSP